MRVDDVVVEVRDKTLRRRGQIPPELLDVQATLPDPVLGKSGVGEWTLALPAGPIPAFPEVEAMVRLLRTPGSGLIVTHKDPAVGVLWSGPMWSTELDAGVDDPAGTVTVHGVTDDVILWRRLAYQTPGTADVTAQSQGWDVRSGVGETVMRAYVSANIGPTAPAGRRITALSLAPDLGRGGSVTYSARMDVLGDVLAQLGARAGLGFRVVQVGSGLVFEVFERRDRTGRVRLDILNGTLSSHRVVMSAPPLTRAIVAGQGEGADRTFVERTSAESLAAEVAWGLWGRGEEFADQRHTDDPTELAQAGDERVAEAMAGTTSVTAVPADDQVMAYPTDWRLGDRVTVVVEDQETSAPVTSVQILIDRDGCRVGAGIGPASGWRPPATTAQVDAVAARVSQIERNADVVRAQSYTPVLTASVTNPSLGASPIVAGEYVRQGDWVTGWVTIILGSGATAGSGTYYVSLPVAAAASSSVPTIVTGAVINPDTGQQIHVVGFLPVVGGISDRVQLRVNGTSSAVAHNVPWAWGVNAQIRVQFAYRAA